MTMPGAGWGNPVVGGTALRIPAINSPNFNLVTPASSPTPSWAILQNGLAYFFGLVLSGGTITGPDYIINTSGIFIYSGTPALGNLIGSWAGVAGTDAFGNTYPQGFNITQGSISGTVFSGTDFILNISGLFFYSGTPALGNLIMSAARVSGTDGLGNAYLAGWVFYSGTGNVRLTDNSGVPAILFTPNGATHLSGETPQMASTVFNTGLVNEYYITQMLSGKASGNSDTGIQAFSASADNTIAATAKIEFGGTVSATFILGQMALSGANSPAVILTPVNGVHITTAPQFNSQAQNPGAANEQLLTFFTSGKESSLDDAAIQLFSESADATVPARVVIEFGGAVVAEFHRDGGLQLDGVSTPAGTSNNAVLFSTTKGNLQVVDGLDGTVYGTQRRTLILGNNTPLAVSPGTTVFSSPVGVRSYLVTGQLIVSAVTLAQQLSINIAPPAGTGHAAAFLGRALVFTATDFNLNSLTGIGAGGNIAAGQTWVCRFETIMNVTGAGTFNFICAGTNANDLSVLANSHLTIEPV